MNDDRFSLHLTAAELMCAAMALGLAQLPLPGNRQIGQLSGAIHGNVQEGYHSLQQRGLLHQISAHQWQVDNLLAILIHWMTAPDHTLQLDVWSRQGQRRLAMVYFWQGQANWLLPDKDGYEFTLFRADDTWQLHCLDWLHCRAEGTGENSLLRLPLLNLEKFLPLVWQESEVVKSVLARAGLAPEDVAYTITVLQSVQQVISLTWQSPTVESVHLVLLDADDMIWGQVTSESGQEMVCLRPLSFEDLRKILTPALV